ncbi:TetR/AcrR family transcriptional regulator [Bacillus benzoevorans]|uniref:AcrR family transcriptional regulator n=1 Tax=Bacillus benzoevorans TaxID=1456 RepID=A0A7X0LWL8_9BACI|nr:TetR/AcrR family transcriptional regulator [Bacillus benzoevorans]MBB6447221.1 AcrR family transcriptional regulator [Bacillus benzoevorans]
MFILTDLVNGITIELTDMVNGLGILRAKGAFRMFAKFLRLDSEKQDRIVNAVMKEFAQKGYERASTNEMVKEAGISKGLLFHYFQNKKQLYLFLVDYCYDMVVAEFYKKIDLTEPDFFKRIREAVHIKMEMLTQYPDIFKFMEEAFLEDAAEIKPELEKKKREMTDINMGKFFEGIDYSKFRADVDLKIVLKIITFTFEKMSEEVLYKAKFAPGHEINYAEIRQEAEQYFDVLIKCFYH